MSSQPFDNDGCITLGEWWAVFLTTEESTTHIARTVGKTLLEGYRSTIDGQSVVIFKKPLDERVSQILRLDSNGAFLKTSGKLKSSWVPSFVVDKKTQEIQQLGDGKAPGELLIGKGMTGVPVDGTPVALPKQAAASPATSPKKIETKPSAPRRGRPPKPLANNNDDDDDDDDDDDGADELQIVVHAADGDGPATKLHPSDSDLGRCVREILAAKTEEVLEVVDDVGLARATQAAIAVIVDGKPVEGVFCNGHFWRYDAKTGVWIKITSEDMQRLITESWWRHPYRKGKKVKALGLSVAKIRSCIEMMQVEMHRPTFFADRKERRGGIAFNNGFATVLDGEVKLLPPSPDHRAEFLLPFDYEPNLACPRWERFLDEVMEPSHKHEFSPDDARKEIDAKKRMLGEYAGICLIGRATHHQKCLILEGRGGNGKSVITKVLLGLFAADSISALAPQDWTNQFNAAMLVGKRLNIAAELPERDMVEGHVFKQIIAGDEVTVQNKFKDPFRANMTAGHVFAANELPHSRDLSDGFWRRFLVLTLEQRFDNRADVDTRLPDTLIESESGGIAVWCLRHAAELERRNGAFSLPSTSVKKKEEWRAASNPIEQFTEEVLRFEKVPGRITGGIKAAKLYEVYAAWAKKRGHGIMSSTKFGSKIRPHLEQAAGRSLDKRTSDGVKYEVDIDSEWRYVLENDPARR